MNIETIILGAIILFGLIGWLGSPSDKENAAAERSNRRLF